jgi:hypothetical protein
MRRAEDMALRRAEQGMSAAERAAFEQGMARRTGAAERAMRNLGMSGVASGISNIFNIDAMNQFAAQSEAERRRGEQMYAGIAIRCRPFKTERLHRSIKCYNSKERHLVRLGLLE